MQEAGKSELKSGVDCESASKLFGFPHLEESGRFEVGKSPTVAMPSEAILRGMLKENRMKRLLLGIVLVLSPFIVGTGCTTERQSYQDSGMNQGQRHDVNTETPSEERAYPQEEPW
jgi:hypothetical protein